MNYKPNLKRKRAKIGKLDTAQFTILQTYLEKVDVPQRMIMLYNQLLLEKE